MMHNHHTELSRQHDCIMLQDEEILTEGSEVERPVGMGEGTSEIGSERRYATRQSTRKQTSQASAVEPEKVYTLPSRKNPLPLYASPPLCFPGPRKPAALILYPLDMDCPAPIHMASGL